MKNKINLLAGVLAVSVFFAGCSIGGKEIVVTSGVGSKDVFKIGGDSCNQTEAKV